MNVGIAELRAKLSEYVRRAQAGETFQVVSHRRPVASLRALPEAGDLTVREARAAYQPGQSDRVAIRALKSRLGEVLSHLTPGEVLVITDRDRDVAELIGRSSRSRMGEDDPRLTGMTVHQRRMVVEGRLTPGDPSVFHDLRPGVPFDSRDGVTLADLVIASHD